ncbi:MAG: YraN family protein [Bacteroidales bacterium]|nr:YraN family protein [Bacteroidales bacterium]
MAQHNELGKIGENIAFQYLLGKGYEIVERNWRFGKDEIDIIARYENRLVIIEVKTRSTDFFGDPEDSVGDKKQQFLIRAADEYVNQKDIDQEVRFDIISIIIEQNKHTVRHIEDAFYPTLPE